MAVDKLVDSAQLNNSLTLIANAIRIRGGTTEQLVFPNGFVNAILAIPRNTIIPSYSEGVLTLSGFSSTPSWRV